MSGDGTNETGDSNEADGTDDTVEVTTATAERSQDTAVQDTGPQPAETQVGASQPAQPAQSTEPGRSAVAAALLNLTGIGLGYLYLRRWLRGTACAVIFVLMVVVAFANDAASEPWFWRVLAAVWIAATAFDAWWVARASPRPQTRDQWLRPVAAGVLAVTLVIAGHVGYAGAARGTYAAGLEAQGRAACVDANRAFDVVTGPYELTLSTVVPAAAERSAECTAYLAAEEAENAGAHAEAVTAYQAFRRDHPGSLLDPFVHENTRRALLAWAVALRSSGDLDGAIARYRDLLGELQADPGAAQVREDLAATYVERASAARQSMAAAVGQPRVDAMRGAMEDLMLVGRELPETAAAASAPQGIQDTFAQANNAFAEGRFCDGLPVLDYAVTLPESAGIAGVANADRAHSLSECGLSTFGAGDLEGAASRFSTLVADYPSDPGVPQARSALITAEVGSRTTVSLPLPAPIDAPGSESVLVYNATSTDVRVLISGPTAHELTLPGCIGCPSVYETGESCPGPEGKPSTTIRMRTGPYYLLQDRVDPANDNSVNEPIVVQRGGGTLCVTVKSGQ
jgi:tetratricopeptide (TPR) repeat protein